MLSLGLEVDGLLDTQKAGQVCRSVLIHERRPKAWLG